MNHIKLGTLSAGAAGKLYGRLSATNSQTHGCFGRAKLSPTKKRQYEHGGGGHLSRQLLSSRWWWYHALAKRVPRPVPFGSMRRSDLVISYSDGEGGDAGVGVVLFGEFPDGLQPKPVYLGTPPPKLRELWSLQKSRSKTGATMTYSRLKPLVRWLRCWDGRNFWQTDRGPFFSTMSGRDKP